MKDVAVGSYFCTHVFYLLDFDTDDVVSFDIKCFFLQSNYMFTIYKKKKSILQDLLFFPLSFMLSWFFKKSLLFFLWEKNPYPYPSLFFFFL